MAEFHVALGLRTQEEEILRHLGPTQSSRVTLSRWGGIPDGTVVPERRELCEVELPGETPLPRWSSELGQLGASERRPLSTALGLGATPGALGGCPKEEEWQGELCGLKVTTPEHPGLLRGGGEAWAQHVAWTWSSRTRAPGGCPEEERGEWFGLRATTPEHRGAAWRRSTVGHLDLERPHQSSRQLFRGGGTW